MRTNFATLLEAVADVMADDPAVVQAGRTRSWRDLDTRAARLAGHLAACGIGPGSRVAVGLYNSVEYVECVLAALKLRAVPVNINYRYRERELRYVLADSGAVALIYDSSLTERVAAVRPDLPLLRTLIRVGSDGEYEQVLAEAEPMPRIERGNDAWLVYTGGTTGMPKGVLTRHAMLFRAVVANGHLAVGLPEPTSVDEVRASARRRRRDGPRFVALAAPPLMHSTGLYNAFGALLTGGSVVLLASRSYDPQEMARLVAEHRVTDLTIVGDVFARPFADVLERAAAEGRPYDVSSLRRIVSAGVLWSAEVKERLLAHCDAVLQDVLAASEGGPFAMSLTRRGERVATSRFTLFPGARLIDDEGRDVPPGSGRPGYLAAPAEDEISYLGDPAASAATFRVVDGRRYTVPGDLATLEADGSLTLVGRGSRVINTGGEKVYAEEVEQVIADHERVQDVLVVGVPDERFGQRVAAVVAARPGAVLTEQEVRDQVGRVLADYKRPKVVVLVPEVRRSPVGKADLAWARQVAADGMATETMTAASGGRRPAAARRQAEDPVADLLARLEALDTCAVSDALDTMGLPGALTGLRPLWPVERVVVGRVRTLRVGPRAVAGGPTAHLGTPLLAIASPGDVVVIDAGGRTDVSAWGGILSTAASLAGVAGVVVDGACRDIGESEALDLPVFGRAVVPVSARGRIVQLGMDETIEVCGRPVDSGDYLVADRCGVVVVPAGRAAVVVALAERIAAREAEMVASVRAGRPVAEVMHDSKFPTVDE